MLKFNTAVVIIATFFVIVFARCGTGVVPATPLPSASPTQGGSFPYKRIFESASFTNGRIDTNGNTNPSPEADALCNADANKPSGGATFKAMLVSSTRRACTTANCGGGAGEHLDWVLRANQEYRRTDGSTIIGSTNGNAIFTYPLQNYISGTSNNVYTGLSTAVAWTNSAGELCNNWGSNLVSDNGSVGYSRALSIQSIRSGVLTCDQTATLYCVEQ